MRPLRIYLKNFMNHKLSEIDCTSFQSVLIVGKSQKNDRISNGVGKTTIFRAIEYALFNQSYATTLDKVVRDGKRKAEVEFDFDMNGTSYRIYRHRTSTGSADVRFYKKINDVWESISGRSPSDTEAIIRDTIKITHKAFTYSVLFRQADLTGMSSVSDPKKRKEILKEPLNLSAYTKLEDLAIEARKPIKRKIDNLEGSVQVIGDPEQDIEKSEKEFLLVEGQLRSHKDSIVISDAIIKEKLQVIDDLKHSLGQQDIDLHKKISEQEANLKKMKESAKSTDKRLLSLVSLISDKEDYLKSLDGRVNILQDRLAKLLDEKEKDIEEVQSQYDKVSDDALKGGELISAVKTQIKLEKKSLPDSDNCPVCQQDISPEYRKAMQENIESKIKKLEDKLLSLEDSLSKCLRKKARLSDKIKIEQLRKAEYDKVEYSIESLVKEQKSVRSEIDRLYTDQKYMSKALQDYERQIEETNQLLLTLKEAASKSNAIAINQRIFEVTSEISKLQDSLSEHNLRISSLSSVLGGLTERIKTRKADKEKLILLNDDIEKAKKDLKICQMVVDAFSTHGIPNFIIQTILDDLQFETNIALKELRPELDVRIDADLNLEYRRNGVVRDYEQLSHGQHVYIALAFKRGMARVVQKRLGIDIRILEFDEVDSHLDDAGVDAFADSIKKWQKEFTVFVVTHNKDLKDKFSNAILVEESDDGAEAKLVSSW